MKKGEKYWCWWMSRYLIFTGKITKKGIYGFEDFGGCMIYLEEESIKKLEKR